MWLNIPVLYDWNTKCVDLQLNSCVTTDTKVTEILKACITGIEYMCHWQILNSCVTEDTKVLDDWNSQSL